MTQRVTSAIPDFAGALFRRGDRAYDDAEGATGVRRAYRDQTLTRLADTKKRYDPDNVFHLNHNVRQRSDR